MTCHCEPRVKSSWSILYARIKQLSRSGTINIVVMVLEMRTLLSNLAE